MMLHISVDPSSGPVSISVCGESCSINTETAYPIASNGAGSLMPPVSPAPRRSGSLLGVAVIAVVAVLVGAGFGAYRSSNAAFKDAMAEMARSSPRNMAASAPTRQPTPERQGQRVEQALAGQPVVTQPPPAPANGAANPFGLE